MKGPRFNALCFFNWTLKHSNSSCVPGCNSMSLWNNVGQNWWNFCPQKPHKLTLQRPPPQKNLGFLACHRGWIIILHLTAGYQTPCCMSRRMKTYAWITLLRLACHREVWKGGREVLKALFFLWLWLWLWLWLLLLLLLLLLWLLLLLLRLLLLLSGG